ncbi:NLI interacting factor-like phosphatase-domain-containing protein [Phakopsora pachyrhizi]|uniref:NLI interacting factor-like phosphatase-domain-containing protein n=1 Tax=Phakopsora pachyrhizi TaxID=170000 RepID=A0AAV0AI76_PHAPC|nr:NLI interacting factor-like phosphatase-domain-containing protein [Phakopsora pachyrhizi]CAH7687483.1 NLI interacting factor-like phosphatase-domain-containing protein [Phakopsora pachyrhizi]
MNSLSWLLTPKTHQGKQNSSGSSTSDSDPNNNRTPRPEVDLGIGPRERESEWVDDMVDLVERRIGAEAANRLERKASMGLDGQLRFGLPGIIERRRTLHLETTKPTSEEQQQQLQLQLTTSSSPSTKTTTSTTATNSSSTTMKPTTTIDNNRRNHPDLNLSTIPISNISNDQSDLVERHSSSSISSNQKALSSSISNQQSDGKVLLLRLIPARVGIKLYLLIRKFLNLFGLRVDNLLIQPTSNITNSLSLNQAINNNSSKATTTTKPFGVLGVFKSLSLLVVNFKWFRIRPSRYRNSSSSSSKFSSNLESKDKQRQLFNRRNKTLVLDLDETLIHSTSNGSNSLNSGSGASFCSSISGSTTSNGLKARVVEVVLDGRIVVYHVYKRPWVDFFLKTVSSWYTVVIFTASMREYADPVIDWLDQGRGLIDARLFRESCTNIKGSYAKDLSIVEKDLSRVCLVDNSPTSYELNQANGIPIEGWLNDPKDEGLLELLPMLDSLRFTSDVRRILGLRGFGLKQKPSPSSKKTTTTTKKRE